MLKFGLNDYLNLVENKEEKTFKYKEEEVKKWFLKKIRKVFWN